MASSLSSTAARRVPNMRPTMFGIRPHPPHHRRPRQPFGQGQQGRSVATKSAVQASAAAAAAASHPTTVLLSPLILCHHQAPLADDRPASPSFPSAATGVGMSSYPSNLPTHPPASGWKKCIVSRSSKRPSLATRFTSDAAAMAAPPLAEEDEFRDDVISDNSGSSMRGERSNVQSSSSPQSVAEREIARMQALSSGAPGTGHGMDDMLLQVDMDELKELASKRCTPLSLKDMYKYAVVDADRPEQRLWNAQFLHKELPIRMAQRAYDLLTLPHGLNQSPAILQVARVYLLYLEQFQDCPVPTTVELEDRFTDLLQGMVLERSSIPNAIARGVDDWMHQQSLTKTDGGDKEARLREMDDALYRFFTARVGLRFLTEHHILSSPTRATSKGSSALRKSQSSFADLTQSDDEETDEPVFLGCIQASCEPLLEVRKVVEMVRKQTEDYYGICPEIQIVDAQSHQPGRNTNHNFTYVPHHLHYMVSELVKNSCRATVKRHLESPSNPLGTIKVVVVKGVEDVTIKVADRGGGIPRSKMSKIWRFAHSTAASDENDSEFGVDEVTGTQIRGFGLPLARIYARYLGGELTLKSMEGYGLDAYLHLPRLGDACENLPLPVKFSPSNLNSNAPRGANHR